MNLPNPVNLARALVVLSTIAVFAIIVEGTSQEGELILSDGPDTASQVELLDGTRAQVRLTVVVGRVVITEVLKLQNTGDVEMRVSLTTSQIPGISIRMFEGNEISSSSSSSTSSNSSSTSSFILPPGQAIFLSYEIVTPSSAAGKTFTTRTVITGQPL
jgi:hypothetical protein